MCARGSSVASNLAVEGSDIDGGLVVLSKQVDESRQLEFINELRRQGFRVYHSSEVEEARRAWEKADTDYREKEIDISELNKLRKRFLDMESEVILFRTESSLEKEIATGDGKLTGSLDIYLGECEIP